MLIAKRPALALNPPEKCHANKQSIQPSICRGVPAEFADWDGTSRWERLVFLPAPGPARPEEGPRAEDDHRGIHRREHTRPDQRSEVEAMFFDLLKVVGTVVAVLSEVLKLETEAVPVSSNLVVTTAELNLELSGIRKVHFHLSRYCAEPDFSANCSFCPLQLQCHFKLLFQAIYWHRET